MNMYIHIKEFNGGTIHRDDAPPRSHKLQAKRPVSGMVTHELLVGMF